MCVCLTCHLLDEIHKRLECYVGPIKSLTWQVNSSQSGDYGWSDLWGGHWGMQHYTEQTWDLKVIEALSAFLIT